MRKKVFDELVTKAKKREVKKRPRMNMHGKSLLKSTPHGGKSLTSR